MRHRSAIRSLRVSAWFRSVLTLFALLLVHNLAAQSPAEETGVKTIGIIGLDTSHVPNFTKTFHQAPPADPALAGFRVVAAYPYGSADIESSASRIPRYTAEVKQLGVDVVDSISEVLKRVDFVLLETNDGRLHLPQALEVFRAGKPVFIDKPAASNLAEVVAIYRAAEHYGVPVFSSSSLRFSKGTQDIRNGIIGNVLGCDSHSPCSIEPTHVELFWYGIHGVETLFTCMGIGCESVQHHSTDKYEVVVGTWRDQRVGTFRGIRDGRTGYGGIAFGSKEIRSIGSYDGYQPLVIEIAKFFRTGQPPVDPAETIELYAFMQAAAESKLQNGKPITIESVMKAAEKQADVLLEGKLTTP